MRTGHNCHRQAPHGGAAWATDLTQDTLLAQRTHAYAPQPPVAARHLLASENPRAVAVALKMARTRSQRVANWAPDQP